MTQLEIDWSKRARRTDAHTSHEAAARAGEFAHGHHAAILGSLMTQGPADIYELAWRTGIDHVAVARRMSELLKLKAVERTGETRPTPSGRRAMVWRAK